MSHYKHQNAGLYRESMLKAVINEYNLTDIYNYSQNAEAATHATNQYHNTGHCARVAFRAFELMNLEGNRLRRENAIILAAGLFHDFGHLGSDSRSDRDNIEIAVQGMKGCDSIYEYFGDEAIKEIESLIRCTEYDYATKSFPVDPINLTQECLRDADLMESLEPNALELIQGLCIEVRMAYQDFLPKQLEFMQNTQMFTRAGNIIWQNMLPQQLALYTQELRAMMGPEQA